MPKRKDRDSPEDRARLNLAEVIRALREESAAIDDVILAFERIAAGQPKRRGRPPKWLSEAKGQKPPKD